MNRFALNSTTSEELRFTVRIEHFSMLALRGHFVSPEFESEYSDTKWSLVVGVNDGADYDNYIDVRLRRNDSRSEEQLVKTKVSIAGIPYLPPLTEDNEQGVFFGQGRRDAQVLTVTKKRLFACFGLNKLRLLPKDTLTLVCHLVIHKYRVQTFDRRRDFEDVMIMPVHHHGPGADTAVEYFAHASMEPMASFDFVRRFGNFSVHCRSGRCASPEFSSDERPDCKWSLVVYTDFSDDSSFDVRLKRSDSSVGNGEFVEVKLSVVDAINGGTTLSTVKKRLYFRGSADEEILIRTITKRDMSRWLFPDDTLTLKCETTVFEETASTERKTYLKRIIGNRSASVLDSILLWFTHVLFLLLPFLISIIGFVYTFGKYLVERVPKALVTASRFCKKTFAVVVTVVKFCKMAFVVLKSWVKYLIRTIFSNGTPTGQGNGRNQRNYNSSTQIDWHGKIKPNQDIDSLDCAIFCSILLYLVNELMYRSERNWALENQ